MRASVFLVKISPEYSDHGVFTEFFPNKTLLITFTYDTLVAWQQGLTEKEHTVQGLV